MGTQEQQTVEELGAQVAGSALTPLRYLERSASVWRERPAVVAGEHTWTYGEHYDRVRRAAGALQEELDIEPGDRLAVLLPHVAPMLERHYAAPGVGGVLVPLNTRLASAEYAYILEHCGARVLVAYRPLQAALDPALEELGDDAPGGVVDRGLRELGEAAPRVVWVEGGARKNPEYDQFPASAEPIDLERPQDER